MFFFPKFKLKEEADLQGQTATVQQEAGRIYWLRSFLLLLLLTPISCRP